MKKNGVNFDINLDDKTVIKVKEITVDKYNVEIFMKSDANIVVYDVERKKYEKMRSSDKGILNKKKGIFSKFISKCKDYKLYFISNAPIRGTYGGHFLYNDDMANNKNEKIYIRIEYKFEISEPVFAVKNLTENNRHAYESVYLNKKINPKINNHIISLVSAEVKIHGIVEVQERLASLSKKIKNKLENLESLYDCGISITEIDLKIEEDYKHRLLREKVQSAELVYSLKGE